MRVDAPGDLVASDQPKQFVLESYPIRYFYRMYRYFNIFFNTKKNGGSMLKLGLPVYNVNTYEFPYWYGT